MAPTLYYILGGPPSRVALLTIRYLNLDVNLRPIDMAKQEHLSPEYLKLNPSHSVPFLQDGNFVLFESRAISQYLIETYKPDSTLLGSSTKERALVQQFLQFDLGRVFESLKMIYGPLVQRQATVVSEAVKQRVRDVIGTLDTYLVKSEGPWIAGEDVTLADLSLLATVSTIVELGLSLNPYGNVKAWYERAQSLPGWSENIEGAKGTMYWTKSFLTEDLTF